MHKPLRTLISAAVLGSMSGSVLAGGFSLYTESNGAAVGNFAAGIAAEARDASTGWYNPAGLALIRDQQAVFGGVGVFPVAKISGTSTYATPGADDYVENFYDLDGGKNAFVPSFHYARPLGENATFGLSLVSPFGLSTEWNEDSAVRYAATFTELMTINLSPEIGARIMDNLAIGAGIDLQYARVKFNRMLGAPTIYQDLNPFAIDTLSYNEGNSYGVGFHAGVLSLFNDNHTRVGLNYQSKMKHKFHGYSRLSGTLASPGFQVGTINFNPGAVFQSDNLFSNNIELPEIATLSAYHDVNDKLALLGSVVYTGWGSFKTIQLNNVAAPAVNPNTGVVSQVNFQSTASQNYDNAWRFALGANYRFNDLWMLRVGGGYDQTPTNDVDRDVRLPDASRWALAIGAHYQMRPNIGVDFGYTHLWAAETPTINKTEHIGTSTYNVNARGDAYANLVGAQLVWLIDGPAPVVATK